MFVDEEDEIVRYDFGDKTCAYLQICKRYE